VIEPISPELALIDPALARAHRTWLASLPLDRALLTLPARALPAGNGRAATRARPSPPVTAAPWRFRLTQLALLLSLMANGLMVAIIATRDSPSETPLTTSVLTRLAPSAASKRATVDAASGVERRILMMLTRYPAKRLPAGLIDKATGLPKNNLQVVCRADRSAGYRCVIRAAGQRPGQGVHVRYRGGRFIWYRYRPA
jgi:hypothetical protein